MSPKNVAEMRVKNSYRYTIIISEMCIIMNHLFKGTPVPKTYLNLVLSRQDCMHKIDFLL